MPSAQLNIDKVDDKAEPKSIRNISGDTGEQKRKRAENPIVGPRRTPEEIDNECGRNERDYRQSPSSGVSVIVEHAEGDARIVRVRKVQKSRNHRNIIAKPQ